jgi:predicted RNase H-like HicB family nuclease
MVAYIGLIHKERNSSFGVHFPDFPGCITAGETLEEVHRRASEALKFHIRGMIEDGDPIPEPSSLDRIMEDAENKGAVPFLVSVPATGTRRVNITIPETDLEAIDRYARKHNLSRSAFLLRAARRALLPSPAS